MDTKKNKKEDRSGVRLISLLGNHLKEILKRESDNRAFIHLYCTGPYWVAFEKSAYLLRQISSRTLVTPLSLTTYPFPIVMVSWTDGELRSYTCNHLFHREGNDYGRLSVPTRTLDGYKEWHKEEVRCFPMPEVKTTSMDRDMEID